MYSTQPLGPESSCVRPLARSRQALLKATLLMFQAIVFLVLAFWGWQTFFGDKSGCDEYASEYSCKYVTDKATYEVWYWLNVEENNPDDDKFIGTAVGLSACRTRALAYYGQHENFKPWNDRSYICALMDEGRRMEKHRYKF